MKIVDSQSKGFTLIEVLIALIISSIALLGLASGQLKSLQYATNSFNYTVSLIQANNAIERMWVDICALQRGDIAFDQAYISSLDPEFDRYNLDLEGVDVAAGTFDNDFIIKVNWENDRIKNEDKIMQGNINLDNQIAINATFPQLPVNCNV
ncbi:prepilin-type N-terminal cleavage/methylation domain-containing protein [Pseudoalteromonas sp. C2R02]|uniref:type IV pilus modification PilV family protein n=1 Tax=Pseudoalteromonas sp. C2R02 TaxID=2841565 RepID=UPI001C085F4C|nr:prepilin-type N-terminal cleavage/methylation domain-containing protein [Pseudoalteromonas sp. C2R02]MBU2971801.1 prepilin-type N-terminal cleavage/methylation domain-containing protein [Pseudoalteromonas sp. C2R02]